MKKIKNTTGRDILVCDLKRENKRARRMAEAGIRRVLNRGRYILGQELEMLEKEFSRYVGSSFASGVASGTEALQLALTALSIGAGDEVITAVNTAIPTAMAITASGAAPRFVDIEEDTFNIDSSKIEAAVTKKTKAIIPVHLYGNPCDIDGVLRIAKKFNLYVVEDACQAHGAAYKGKKTGGFGDIGAFSFYPTKNLGCYGDGGMVVTDDSRLARKIALLRNYGQSTRYRCEICGINSRLDEIQAAVLRAKLKYLDNLNARRRSLAHLYGLYLQDIPEVTAPVAGKYSEHIYHLYVIKCKDRDRLKEYLRKNGVETEIHYPVPLHLQAAFRSLSGEKGRFEVAERLSKRILTLPIFSELKPIEVKRICGHIRDFYKTRRF